MVRKETMSEYMKEQLGGREFLEGNFQGGGSITDIMLMNINPMTAAANAQPVQPQPVQTAQNTGNIEITPGGPNLHEEMMASIEKNLTGITPSNNPIDVPELPGGGIDYTVDPVTGRPLNDPRDPRRDPLTREILDQSELVNPMGPIENPLPDYKDTVKEEHATWYNMDPNNMKWDDTKTTMGT